MPPSFIKVLGIECHVALWVFVGSGLLPIISISLGAVKSRARVGTSKFSNSIDL